MKGIGLGRGFDALIPTDLVDEEFDLTASEDKKESELLKLKLSEISPDENQPRRDFAPEAMEALAASIKEHGVLQPIVVTKEDGKYKIYGQANLVRRNFDYGDNFVTEKTYKQLKNYEVLPNDICVSMMGTIGKCCVVSQNINKGIMDSHLIKIRLFNKLNQFIHTFTIHTSQ